MINKETIISSFDDKSTLLKWLKKVEAALKNASAVSFNVNKRGDATLTFSIVFDDGSEIESNEIILQQGESVQAATIRNGHLILTLTNGDELDAGDLGGVSGFNINASQHLIVTYQNGTTQDLGAIFSGNVVISGNFEVTGLAKLPSIEGDENGDINVDGNIVISDGNIVISDGAVSTPILTSQNDHIEAQKPVVETMQGYGYLPNQTEGITYNLSYVGVVKNGNKLTMAVAGIITTPVDMSSISSIELGGFSLPSSVLDKLRNTNIGGTNVLSAKSFSFINAYNDTGTSVTVSCRIITNIVWISIVSANTQLQANKNYFFRYEETFLLSENLAA